MPPRRCSKDSIHTPRQSTYNTIMASHILAVFHSRTGRTLAMVEAACCGVQRCEQAVLRKRWALSATAEDLLWADGLLLGTPENFGYMTGAMKEFLDRIFYAVEATIRPLPYALLVNCGNDGSGAVHAVQRIVTGLRLKAIAEPIVCKGTPPPDVLETCTELGQALAEGVAMGIF